MFCVAENDSGECVGSSTVRNRIFSMTVHVLCLCRMLYCTSAAAVVQLLEMLPGEVGLRRGTGKEGIQ
jgi:hypothetical protein